MAHLTRIVIWLCKRFNRAQLEFIVVNLIEVLQNKHADIKPKDDFKEQHPNYRDFYVDTEPPLDFSGKAEIKSSKDWRKIIKEYQKKTAHR